VRISPGRYRTITAIALGLLMVIVVTGAAVRLTGSGLGCDDWPRCNDQQLVDVSSGHAAIEQVNRLFTGLVAVAVILAVLGSLWRVPRRRDLTWLSLGLVAGVIGQIVLGGITVLVDLNPVAVGSHMLLSQAIVACAVVLMKRAGEPDGPRLRSVTAASRWLAWAVAAVTGAAIVAGTVVTGAGPHAGDEDVGRYDVPIADAARVHGTLVLVAVALAVVLGIRLQRHAADRRVLQGVLSSWIFVALLQAAIGYIQYFNDVPALLVGIHVAGATALWAMTVWLVLATAAVEPARSMDVDRAPAGTFAP
jgi:cytochrome c oxidase assembly protein subunit 15